MDETLRLRLKPGFRDPVTTGAGFVGRRAEHDRLTAILRQRSAATVLVSGHRGVGKTTLVEAAIRNSEDPNRIVVRLSLPHIENSTQGADLRGQILRSLARRLYFEVKGLESVDADLKQQAAELYEKSYLKELQRQGALESLAQIESTQASTTERVVTAEPGRLVGALLGSSVSAAIAAGGVAVASSIADTHGVWWGVAAVFVVVAAGVASAVTVRRGATQSKTATDKLLRTDTKSQTGAYDLSPETLEYELQELVTRLHAAGKACVFVIDELDKLDAFAQVQSQSTLRDHVIFRIVASLKNFFTLGRGVFIFIAGDEFFRVVESAINETGYSVVHTVFTDRIFLHALHYRDIEDLIDGSLLEVPGSVEYRRFRNFLCWESENHVFDLLTTMGDYVRAYDGNVPVLVAERSREVDGAWREGNLPDDWVTAAGPAEARRCHLR